MTKIRSCLLLVIIVYAPWAYSQTADQSVAAGRQALTQENLGAAYSHFQQAVSTDPNHVEANVLFGIVRMLNLTLQPAFGTVLNTYGFSGTGRDIYQWRSEPALDANGFPIPPMNSDPDDVLQYLYTNALTEITAAQANLALAPEDVMIELSSSETRFDSFMIDYADIQMVRAIMAWMQFKIAFLNSINLWQDLRNLYNQGAGTSWDYVLDAQDLLDGNSIFLLASYPSRQFEARQYLASAFGHYLNSAEAALLRESSDLRLFSIPEGEEAAEEEVRIRINRLLASLSSPIVLKNDAEFDLATFLSLDSYRDQLWDFEPGSFVPESSTLPDPTLGGTFSRNSMAEFGEFWENLDDFSYLEWKEFTFGFLAAYDEFAGDDVSLFDDGLTNIEKFGFGLEIDERDPAHLPTYRTVTYQNETYSAVTYRRQPDANSGVIYTFQVSPTLGTGSWTTIQPVLVDRYIHADGSEEVTYRDTQPLSAAARRFFRIVISRSQ